MSTKAAVPLHRLLSGWDAFYKQADYLSKTKSDLASPKAVQTLKYVYNTPETDSKITRLFRFPIILISLPLSFTHKLVGRIIIPSSFYSRKEITATRKGLINLTTEWKFWHYFKSRDLKILRLTLSVDGYDVDVQITGRASRLGNKRWMVATTGNGECSEEKIYQDDILKLMDKTKTNLITFNYPGVSGSSGWIDRRASAKAYKAVLRLLEDDKMGIGAKKIVLGPSFSISGGISSDALESHPLKDKVKYVYLCDKTFADLSSTVNSLIFRPLGYLVMLLGWNLNPAKVSKKIKCPQIIVQRADVRRYTDLLKHPAQVLHDGIIAAKASLAYRLLNDPTCPKQNKCFIGVPDQHNDGISNVNFLANKINNYLDGSFFSFLVF